MARPRLWFYSELYWPEETSTGYFVTRIAEDLTRHAQVFAVCSQPTYSSRGKVAPLHETRGGVRIERVRSTTLNKDNLLFRAINVLTFSLAVLYHAAAHLRRGDIVVAVTNPPVVPYLLRIASAFRGSRFVLLVHDVYPEVLIATGLVRAGSWLARLMESVSGWLYRHSDRVVVLGRDMQNRVSDRLGRSRGRTRVITNWGDVDRVRPDPGAGAVLRRTLRLDHKLIVQYLGNMGRTHDLFTLVDVAASLTSREHIRFLLVGWGAQRQAVEGEVVRRGLVNVELRGPCRPDELNAYLNAADIAIIPFKKGMAGLSVPSRMYNVMAAGKPLIALTEEESELAQVVKEERIGWVIPPEDAEALTDLLVYLDCSRNELRDAGARARDAAVLRYSRAVIASEWRELVRELAPGGHHMNVRI
jgi:glycosyltransferase involved in cell wall biosynthesis